MRLRPAIQNRMFCDENRKLLAVGFVVFLMLQSRDRFLLVNTAICNMILFPPLQMATRSSLQKCGLPLKYGMLNAFLYLGNVCLGVVKTGFRICKSNSGSTSGF